MLPQIYWNSSRSNNNSASQISTKSNIFDRRELVTFDTSDERSTQQLGIIMWTKPNKISYKFVRFMTHTQIVIAFIGRIALERRDDWECVERKKKKRRTSEINIKVHTHTKEEGNKNRMVLIKCALWISYFTLFVHSIMIIGVELTSAFNVAHTYNSICLWSLHLFTFDSHFCSLYLFFSSLKMTDK